VTPAAALASTVPAAAVPSAAALDGAARTLLDRLAEETRRADEALGAEDVAGLLALLDARDAMLTALAGIGASLGRSAHPVEARSALIAKTSELQRANVALMQRVQRECDRLTGAIAALDRPDNVAGAYAAPIISSRLNLRR
jgi:hypothetical protein